jgi:hypothetical protein
MNVFKHYGIMPGPAAFPRDRCAPGRLLQREGLKQISSSLGGDLTAAGESEVSGFPRDRPGPARRASWPPTTGRPALAAFPEVEFIFPEPP